MKRLSDEKGSVSLVLLLLMIPLFLTGIFMISEHPRWVHGSDIDLGRTVAEAARFAAMAVDERSQAFGHPCVRPEQAHTNFQRYLRENTRLSRNQEYQLIVYNGQNDFGFPEMTLYENEVKVGDFNSDGVFELTDYYPDAAARSVTLESPGCIAIVKAEVQPTVGTPEQAVRWASAEVVRH